MQCCPRIGSLRFQWNRAESIFREFRMAPIVFCIIALILGSLMIWCALSGRASAMAARIFIQNLPNQRGPLAAFGAAVILLTFGTMLILVAAAVAGLNYFDPDEHHPTAALLIILGANFGPLLLSPLIATVLQKRRS